MEESLTKRQLLTLLVTTFIASLIFSGCIQQRAVLTGPTSQSKARKGCKFCKPIYITNSTKCTVLISNLNGARYGTVDRETGATLYIPLDPYLDSRDEFKLQAQPVGKNPTDCRGVQFEDFDNNLDPEDFDIDID